MLDTLVVTLFLTIPSTSARELWIPPGDRDTPGDSIGYVCDPGLPTHDLDSLRFYAIPTTGGGWRLVYAKGCRHREGEPDTTRLVFPGWSGAHLHVVAVDTAGNASCASGDVYKGPVTGVAEPPRGLSEQPVAEWFDVQGRRLQGLPRGSGVYFVRWRVGGKLAGRPAKVPFLEGRPLLQLRPP